jgi:hypothetical protein
MSGITAPAPPPSQIVSIVKRSTLQFDICSASWQSLFNALAKNVVTAATKYKLSAVPKPGTVKVWFDAAAAVQGVDYSYDALVNQVVLLKLPAAGAKIKVCFEV